MWLRLKKCCDVYGHDAVSVCVAQSWFKRFQFGNFDVKDAPHSGRLITEKVDEIMEKVEQDRHISSYDIGKEYRSQNSFKPFEEG